MACVQWHWPLDRSRVHCGIALSTQRLPMPAYPKKKKTPCAHLPKNIYTPCAHLPKNIYKASNVPSQFLRLIFFELSLITCFFLSHMALKFEFYSSGKISATFFVVLSITSYFMFVIVSQSQSQVNSPTDSSGSHLTCPYFCWSCVV